MNPCFSINRQWIASCTPAAPSEWPHSDLLELSDRVPPADRLYYVQKPFHSVEIRQLALALGEKWRGEREMAKELPRAPEGGSTDAPEMSPAGVLVFDVGDRLLSANPTIARLFPELATVFDEIRLLLLEPAPNFPPLFTVLATGSL